MPSGLTSCAIIVARLTFSISTTIARSIAPRLRHPARLLALPVDAGVSDLRTLSVLFTY